MRRRYPIQRPVLRLLAAVAILATGPARGDGEPTAVDAASDEARLAGLRSAVVGTPSMTAARARVEAARERLGAAGRLADPELELMGSRADMIDDDTTMWELNLRQALPKRGERGADRDRAAAAVAMAEADFALMAGELSMDLAMAAAESEGAERRAALLEQQVARMEAVLGSVDARLAAGVGRLADRLTVQTQIASMRLMIETERRMADDARTNARALLGQGAEAPIPPYAAPPLTAVQNRATPAALLAQARESEATAMKAMAEAGGRPMTGVGLRLEREQTRMGNEDTIGLAFMTEIPWRSRRYARAEARAAVAEAAAARAEGASARLRADAAVARVERADRLAATARRLSADTRARLEAEFEALVRASATGSPAGGPGMGGESTVLAIVDILEKATDTELQAIDAETQARISRAALWLHVPAASWPVTPDPATPFTTQTP